MISREQASRFVMDKESKHSAMVRKGWVLPHKKQAICTEDFMDKVRRRQCWCPTRDLAVNATLVLTPPPRHDLAARIDKRITHLVLENKHPDSETDPLIETNDYIKKKLADS